jgi:hypothetical protein
MAEATMSEQFKQPARDEFGVSLAFVGAQTFLKDVLQIKENL